jgi:hypothetical protein
MEVNPKPMKKANFRQPLADGSFAVSCSGSHDGDGRGHHIAILRDRKIGAFPITRDQVILPG